MTKQRKPHWTEQEEATAEALYLDGNSTAEIADKVGRPHAAVRRKISRMGYPRPDSITIDERAYLASLRGNTRPGPPPPPTCARQGCMNPKTTTYPDPLGLCKKHYEQFFT